jgi:hypothetical protein
MRRDGETVRVEQQLEPFTRERERDPRARVDGDRHSGLLAPLTFQDDARI